MRHGWQQFLVLFLAYQHFACYCYLLITEEKYSGWKMENDVQKVKTKKLKKLFCFNPLRHFLIFFLLILLVIPLATAHKIFFIILNYVLTTETPENLIKLLLFYCYIKLCLGCNLS